MAGSDETDIQHATTVQPGPGSSPVGAAASNPIFETEPVVEMRPHRPFQLTRATAYFGLPSKCGHWNDELLYRPREMRDETQRSELAARNGARGSSWSRQFNGKGRYWERQRCDVVNHERSSPRARAD